MVVLHKLPANFGADFWYKKPVRTLPF